MRSVSDLRAEMLQAGAPAEAILIAITAVDDATRELREEIAQLRAMDAERRTKRTVQKRTEREVSREVAATVERLSRDNSSDTDATKGATVASEPASPSPPKRYNQTPPSTPTLSVEAQAREWFSEIFYPGWPHKVGRAQAEKAAIKLFRARRGDMAAVIAGRDRYVRDKPVDRPWLNPASFLNGERFDDRPAAVARAGPVPAKQKPNGYYAGSLTRQTELTDVLDRDTSRTSNGHADSHVEREHGRGPTLEASSSAGRGGDVFHIDGFGTHASGHRRTG